MAPPVQSWLHRRLRWLRYFLTALDSQNDDQQPLLQQTTSSGSKSSVSCPPDFTSSPYRAEKKPGITTPSPSNQLEEDMNEPPLPFFYCRACKQARLSNEYNERVARLIDRLYCAGCQTQHPAILFSHSYRNAEPSTRLCIGHQGHYAVCCHLKLSLSDIEAWKAANQEIKLSCPLSTCPCTNVTVTYDPGWFDDPNLNHVWVKWRAPIQHTLPGNTFWDRSISKAAQLYGSCPYLFCAALQVTPGRLFRLGYFKDDTFGDGRKNRKCLKINGSFFKCDLQNEIIESSRCIPQGKDPRTLLPRDWIENLDPESYGHFTDPETKHITWCSDRSCATTLEYDLPIPTAGAVAPVILANEDNQGKGPFTHCISAGCLHPLPTMDFKTAFGTLLPINTHEAMATGPITKGPSSESSTMKGE
ncbi:uncharacterized protein NECHADRAFT_82338 [Fusarium vanettenii 77-13-4]|uniref:Uncharacterized protein n=1 Tax=Fusarium vanettenii (strain ATCC MYA-4622 / CBS 123669 / FGSC 9596 / NRRL 45880 / 77-13-4) TaxID=660122 RepID=C7ZMR3_FUSV7|nr:uncharacterized protein NECHADRAFT_82338 [Fusarium vanettenii 77-13-4]EEU34664.1 predicted protein [Fusarium vanettenii 77-13-4]